jgi:hypothetical protein
MISLLLIEKVDHIGYELGIHQISAMAAVWINGRSVSEYPPEKIDLTRL